ncbi:MAG: glycosyltransferase family 4 protein [Lachnospiraceae bacterium]|nr:glycosyltransferase family 4 protein [Lachnospiraceae bacterium]
MNRIKVMYVSNEAGIGGAMQSLLDMIKSLEKQVNPVVLLPSKGEAESWLRTREIPYFIVPYQMSYGKIGHQNRTVVDKLFVNNYAAAWKITEIIKNEKIQMVHSNSIVTNVGAIAALMAGVPHIWHIRELLEEDFESEIYDKELAGRLHTHADAFVSISEVVKKSYHEKYGLKSTAIYDGIDPDRYKTDLDLQKDRHLFLLAGFIQPGKGQWEAVRAFEILAAAGHKDLRLLIVGKSSDKYVWSLKKYIKAKRLEDTIHIFREKQDLSALRKQCMFSLTTSKMEALGRITIEAMLAGNIVIGANSGGTLEIIGERRDRGYLYQQGDAASLASVIQEVIAQSEAQLCNVQKNAQEYAAGQFHLEKYAKEILILYKNASEKKTSWNINARNKLVEDLRVRYQYLMERQGFVEERKDFDKWHRLFLINNRWLQIRQQGNSLADFFTKNKIKQIAIYGMGHLGRSLYDELEESDVTVRYAIDRNPGTAMEVLKIVSPDGELEEVDAVVITALEAEEIKIYLEKKCSYEVIKLTDILTDIEEDRGKREARG